MVVPLQPKRDARTVGPVLLPTVVAPIVSPLCVSSAYNDEARDGV
jgi:hypothetical protein